MSLQGKVISKKVSDLFWKQELTLSTAESCTAGQIAALITTVPGSSHFYKGGVVAYSNEVKENVLGVNSETIEKYGVVSEETAVEMAKGAQKLLNTDVAVATTGVAGPTGGSHELPVGTIWIAVVYKEEVSTIKLEGDFGREKNVAIATLKSIELLMNILQSVENE